jgi:hypothetical protein
LSLLRFRLNAKKADWDAAPMRLLSLIGFRTLVATDLAYAGKSGLLILNPSHVRLANARKGSKDAFR